MNLGGLPESMQYKVWWMIFSPHLLVYVSACQLRAVVWQVFMKDASPETPAKKTKKTLGCERTWNREYYDHRRVCVCVSTSFCDRCGFTDRTWVVLQPRSLCKKTLCLFSPCLPDTHIVCSTFPPTYSERLKSLHMNYFVQQKSLKTLSDSV